MFVEVLQRNPKDAEKDGQEADGRWLLSGAYEQGCKYAKGPPFKAEGVYLTPAKASAVRHEANRSGNTGLYSSSLIFPQWKDWRFFYFVKGEDI